MIKARSIEVMSLTKVKSQLEVVGAVTIVLFEFVTWELRSGIKVISLSLLHFIHI